MAALLLDGLTGEVGGAWHPVALIGRTLSLAYRPWRRRTPVVELAGGALGLMSVATLAAVVASTVEGLTGRSFMRPLVAGLLLKQTLPVRCLLEEAAGVADALDGGQLDEARVRLRALVSRPTEELDAGLCAAAAIESVAENLGDSIAAPVLFYLLLGLPGAVAYRVVNTADSMFGYHGETEWLGKAAARIDDILSWASSRLAALALIGAAVLLRGRAAAASAWSTWRRDGGRTASPNAGRPMAAMAGALERRLEKRGHYVLGDAYREPGPGDIRAAIQLTGVGAALLAAVALLWEEARR